MYDIYKRLRNELTKQSLIPSLRVVSAWMQHLQYGTGLPNDIEIPEAVRLRPRGVEKGIYEWELAVLAKELFAIAPIKGVTSFITWKGFNAAVYKLKDLDNAISQRYEKLIRENILVEMSRHSHHQFGWQHHMGIDAEITRYLKIFSAPALNELLQANLGIDARALAAIGLALSGHFLQSFELVAPFTVELKSATQDQVRWCLDKYSRTVEEMRVLCEESQSFNEDFRYSFNPLLAFPLVSYTSSGKVRYVAPLLPYVLRRFTEGIYYDIWRAKGFDAAFGDSYQSYIGDVIRAVNGENRLTLLEEKDYSVGNDLKQSVDWIVIDQTAQLFIECKTKRLRQDAKIALTDQGPLNKEIGKLADFAVQIYRALADALDGNYQHWVPNGTPIYPIIVTMEEWYFFGHELAGRLEAKLVPALQQAGLDQTLLTKYPFTICSAAEFERLMALTSMIDVNTVMAAKVDEPRRWWLLHSALSDAFPDKYPDTRQNLFPETFNSIG